MLDSTVKRKLLNKIDNLIAEKKESERLKKEFVDWFNSGEPFINFMNDSEKRILEKYPKLVIKRNIYINIHSNLRWGNSGMFKNIGIFDNKDRELIDDDYRSGFYSFDLITCPALFNMDYSFCPSENSNKELVKLVVGKICELLRVRKKYLEKKGFIKRVLDSRELTMTILKKNYKELYDLL